MEEVIIREEYLRTVAALKAGGVENYTAEAGWLVRECFGCEASALFSGAAAPLPRDFRRKVKLRAGGMPLQYILGSQEFCGLEIAVGKGVLIPRADTETVVNCGLVYIKDMVAPTVWDLCAGSGCISLALAARKPGCRIIAVEKYAAALNILNINIAACGRGAVTAVKADILTCALTKLPAPELIISNPPYIARRELAGLQREVGFEPATALDGGEDGLKFYRRLAVLGQKRLNPGGMLCVEVGAGQAEQIKALFEAAGYAEIGSDADGGGVERAVYAAKR